MNNTNKASYEELQNNSIIKRSIKYVDLIIDKGIPFARLLDTSRILVRKSGQFEADYIS